MDESHLLMAARYIELNPVRAGLVRSAAKYTWSSVHAHLAGKDGGLVSVKPLLDLVTDWPAFLRQALRVMNCRFCAAMNGQDGRRRKIHRPARTPPWTVLKKQKPGPKPSSAGKQLINLPP